MRRIVLGEFVDDFDIGTKIAEWLNISKSSADSSEEPVGDERLGPKNIFGSFGPSMIVIVLILLLVILIIAIAVTCSKYGKVSQKTYERMQKLKRLIFWNPLIRFTMLNSLKLDIGALVVFQYGWPDSQTVGFASIFKLIVLIGLPVFFTVILYKMAERLSQEENVASIGTLYHGLYLPERRILIRR